MGGTGSRRGLLTAAVAAVAFLAPALSAADASAAGQGKGGGRVTIEALSGHPDLVTGGDALLEVRVPKGTKASRVRILRNGANVTKRFGPSEQGPRTLVGLVDGLRKGANLILARGEGSNRPAKLTLFNSPIAGPILSGPHQSPFVCTTAAAGLGAATDPDCSAPTKVEYRYRSTDNSFKPLADPASRPPDLAQTITRDGEVVDYVVRIESGVINRSIYRWAILAPGGEIGQGWNERFVYSFGGGCSAGYQQGESEIGAVLDNRDLSRGYSTISSSLNVLNTACNDVLSAETAAMVKEHVIESLGRPPVWTVGEGGSGGSVQQQMIAQNYPGLLDGLIPGASFPDNSSSAYPDCRLLNAYFATPDGSSLSPAQRSSITGLENPNACQALGAGADVVNATEGCIESVVGAALIYDPLTNPDGARCTVWDSLVNIYGRDPATGFARRTLDNVGRQYGLLALQEGTISKAEFLDLNEAIGGYDNDGNVVASRAVANPDALEIAYRTGRINRGAGGMDEVPIIDIRDYVDDEVNVHQYVNTFVTRARLDRTNGTHANQVMFRTSGNNNTRLMNDAAIDIMGAWLDRIEADRSDRPLSEKVIANKPAEATDACWIGGARINDPAEIGGTGPCSTRFAPHSLPALRAGLPLDSLVAKCQTGPVDPADYGGLTPNQAQRMAAIFPDGVCDYSRPGVGETKLDGTWQEFGPERRVKPRKRKLRLQASGGGRIVALTASLRPCPETSLQRVTFERRTPGTPWRAVGTKVAEGRKCKAKLRTRSAPQFRAVADRLDGYRGAKSKVRKIKRRR